MIAFLDMDLADRQAVEREYFNEIVKQKWSEKDLVVSVSAPSFSDYNGDLFSSWLARLPSLPGARILELGCGSGELAVWLALQGAQVDGVDISDESIRIANARASINRVSDRAAFVAIGGEELPFSDGIFDAVVICVALHHMDVPRTLREMFRVLKPGGRFVAIEPYIFSKTLQGIRESRFIQMIFPERRETPTERMLDEGDAKELRLVFGNGVAIPRRCFSAIIAKFPFVLPLVARIGSKNPEQAKRRFVQYVQKIDSKIFDSFSFMRPFARYAIVYAEKRDDTGGLK